MKSVIDTFKHKIDHDCIVIGPFMKTTDPAFVEITGYAGFDFAILDMEHGPVSLESLQNLIRAAQYADVFPIVRVQDSSEISISKALDIGALGIQVPNITTAEQAQQVVRAAKYAPTGNRGVCRFVRAAKYSYTERSQYFKDSNDILIILQIEGKEGIQNLNGILEVEPIDVIFIGPYDLSQSLGVGGQVDHPLVQDQMKFIIEEAKKREIVIGTFVDTLDNARVWKKMGVQYLSYSVDVGIFFESCKQIVSTIKDF